MIIKRKNEWVYRSVIPVHPALSLMPKCTCIRKTTTKFMTTLVDPSFNNLKKGENGKDDDDLLRHLQNEER